MTNDELQQLADQIAARINYSTKTVLTTEEAVNYMGVSISYIYKLMMRRQIPFYKPMGKLCYFNRDELEQWLQANRVSTDDELEQRAQEYCRKGGRNGRR